MDKTNIIVNLDKGEFYDFLLQDHTGEVLKLFDEEGCQILKRSGRVEDRISYILAHSRYRNELLMSEYFLDVFLSSDISDYYACLNNLNDKTYDLIIERCLSNEKYSHKFAELVSYFNDYYKEKIIKNWTYPFDYLYEIIKTNNPDIINAIVNKEGFDLSNSNLNLRILIETIKSNNNKALIRKGIDGVSGTEITIPSYKIDKSFYDRLWNSNNIFSLRNVVNDCEYCFDTTDLNKYIERKEEEFINSYNKDSLFYDYDRIFESFDALIKAKEMEEKYSYRELETNEEYKRLIEQSRMFHKYTRALPEYMLDEIRPFYQNFDKVGLYNYLKDKSDKMLSNYIIDYHFKENYHNVIIDIRELLNFYFAGNINLDSDRVDLYNKISNIDYLSLEEKLELHKQMKNMNMMEIFYDDMLYSRRLVGEMLKESSLSKESIEEYRDEDLSQQYGLDVYRIEDNPFFAIVKTGRRFDDLPTGHSFSVVGSGGIGVFGDVKDSNTFVYDAGELNKDQIVHMFPFDSFTMYKPFDYSSEATKRVNMLFTPEELMYQTSKYSSEVYNELLLLERGRIKTGIDDAIPELHQIALYCIDEIRSEDVEKAKQAGVGIFLVNSKNYYKGFDAQKDIYRHDVDHWNQNYYSQIDEEKLESKR